MVEVFGRYQLLRRIGVGGMAEVFVAKTYGAEGFVKDVVIKRILPVFGEDPEFVRMFINEARLAAKLQHANIVQIYDFNHADGIYYIAMEWVDGLDLRGVLTSAARRDMPIPLRMAVQVGVETLKGLHYAHTRTDQGRPLGLVHRDISPHNLLVSFAGEVKITDFGIAKAAAMASATRSGSVKGKLAYMSPEQVSMRPVDARSDLYSLGIVLWELLTRRRLYQADSEGELFARVKRAEVPPIRALNPEVPPELEAVILRLLAARPDDRYSVAADALGELSRFAEADDSLQVAAYLQRLLPAEAGRERRGETELALVPPRSLMDGFAAAPPDAPTRSMWSPGAEASGGRAEQPPPMTDGARPAHGTVDAASPTDSSVSSTASTAPGVATSSETTAPSEAALDLAAAPTAPRRAVPLHLAATQPAPMQSVATISSSPTAPALTSRSDGSASTVLDVAHVPASADGAPEATAVPLSSKAASEGGVAGTARSRPPLLRRSLLIVVGCSVALSLSGYWALGKLRRSSSGPAPVASAPAASVPASSSPAVSVSPLSSTPVRAGSSPASLSSAQSSASLPASSPASSPSPAPPSAPSSVLSHSSPAHPPSGRAASSGRTASSAGAAKPARTSLTKARLGRGRAGQFGWLKVSVSPWARVTVDGQDQGQTPISALKLSVGKHRVVLQNEELGRKETVVTIIEAAKTERIGREWTVGP